MRFFKFPSNKKKNRADEKKNQQFYNLGPARAAELHECVRGEKSAANDFKAF